MKVSDIKTGTSVIYWKVIDENGKKYGRVDSRIVSNAWKVGGEFVCMIEKVVGCVAISHLEKNNS